MTTQTAVKWVVKGDARGSCSCDWGCPCNFDAPPTRGWCEGGYAFHINEGRLGDTSLDGLSIGFYAHSPAALHLGNVTAYLLVDEKATMEQRIAIGRIPDMRYDHSGQYGETFRFNYSGEG